MAPSRLISQESGARKKSAYFFHPKLLLPFISMAGPWRKDNIDSLFIPFCASALILRLMSTEGKRNRILVAISNEIKLGSEIVLGTLGKSFVGNDSKVLNLAV